jgi:hypothetical protein
LKKLKTKINNIMELITTTFQRPYSDKLLMGSLVCTCG